ncbi:MAG TPA: vitamin K epoxide reductase family protein [Polyangiales bacterium]|nr:vitamin K epoxide reductase family protein [Polyangiales bacterium]
MFWATAGLSAVALGASAMLFVDYVQPAPVFCAPDGGCGLVRQTQFAYPLGVPLPAIGVLGMFAVAISGLIPGRRARFAHLLLAVTAGLVGLALMGVQLSLQVFCPYCVVVDVASVAIGVLAIVRVRSAYEPALHFPSLIGAGVLLLASIGVPLALGASSKPVLPEVVAHELGKTPPGKLTVIDFVDFECPYCRENHVALAPLLAEHRDKLRVVRKHVPLGMHRYAQHAARAACCGEASARPTRSPKRCSQRRPMR